MSSLRLKPVDVTTGMKEAWLWLEARGGDGAITREMSRGKLSFKTVLANGETSRCEWSTWEALVNRGYCVDENGRMKIAKTIHTKKPPLKGWKEKRKARIEYARKYYAKLRQER